MNATLVACTPDGQILPMEDLAISVVNQVSDDSDDLLTQREAAALAKVDPRFPLTLPSQKSPHEAATSRRPDPERIKTNAHP